jgi:hypothetical protein
MRRPWATFALATAVLLVGLVSLPEQLGLSRQGLAAPPVWFASLADAARPLAALVAPLVPLGPVHALLTAAGVAVAGFGYELRFGRGRTLLTFALGALLPGALALVGALPWLPVGGTAGAMALFGGRLLDMARRGESRSLFGPLVGPLILHGAMETLVAGEWGPVHALGFAAGAVLARALPPAALASTPAVPAVPETKPS